VCDIQDFVSTKGTAALYIHQFSQCDISINASVVLSMLWYRIRGADSGEESQCSLMG
jgi:hypothetical protein